MARRQTDRPTIGEGIFVKQLSGLDATMLSVESDRTFAHVSQLVVAEKPSPDFEPYTAWRTQLADRMHLLEPLRRRLVEVPLGLDHPYWIADPDFDLDFHVRHSAVPPPGTDDQLDTLVGRLVAGPMDRDHPLWVSHVIDGLSDDRFAILTMIHHAAVDGAAGADLLALMLDDTPDAEAPSDAGRWNAEDPPSPASVLGRAALHGLTRPARGLRLAAQAGQHLAGATRSRRVIALADRVRNSLHGPVGAALNIGRERDPDQELPAWPAPPAPPTPFNGPVSRYRRFVHRSTPLADVVAVGQATETSVNDVVVAVCAGALRHWLAERDQLPTTPLVAMIPVSLRTGEEVDPWTNRVSGMAAVLPTDVDDPVARLRAAHDTLEVGKAVFRALPNALTPELIDLSVPALINAIGRVALRIGRTGVAPFNVIISNVPGPTEPLYMAGARARHYYPVSAVVDGQGLNMTVQSYAGSLDFGLLADATLMPDLADLADALLEEVELLVSATT